MENTILLSLTVALCILASGYSVPIDTPLPESENEKEDTMSFDDLEEVMMDPTAKMPWQKQVGDITYLTDKYVFPEDENDPFLVVPEDKRSKRAAIKNKYRLWPGGIVPYKISSSYTEYEKSVIIRAMDHLENKTCIRFHNRTDERDYIGIYPGSGCYSYVGRLTRVQGVSVGRRCFAVHTAIHEIMHALGFYHEQSRPDRDEHVQIIPDNMVDDKESNFEKESERIIDSLGVGYDYNSIMHYDATTYSRNGKPVIVALDPDIPIGGAKELSALDIVQINLLYKCPADPPPRETIAPPIVVEDGPTLPKELPYPACGEIITSWEGTIESPGFPKYPQNVDCVWILKMNLTGFNIIFTLETFDVNESPDCESDYLQIFQSVDTSGYSRGRLCGKYYSGYTTSSLKSYAYLHFHTNGSNETQNLKGFKLKYTAADIDECNPLWKHTQCSHGCHNFDGGHECSCPEGFFMSSDGIHCFDINECGLDKGSCGHRCVNRAGYYHCACDDGYTLLSDNRTCLADVMEVTTVPSDTYSVTVLPPQPSQCGQTHFTESSGTIESPNWPDTYPTNLECHYFIDLPDEDSTIEITFNEGFRIAGSYPECPKDWVKIFDGHTDDANLLGKYCHFHTPPKIITSGPKAKIVLFAGLAHSSSRKGFSASYHKLS